MTDQEPSTDEWDAAAYLVSSDYRKRVVESLTDGPDTPKGIADNSDTRIAHVSRALQQLREEGMAELLVSEDKRKGRIYDLTDKGKRAVETADTIGGNQ